MSKVLWVALWSCIFLVLFDMTIGSITHFQTPAPIQDHDNLGRFLKEDAVPRDVFVGSSRARDLDDLLLGPEGGDLRIVSISGGWWSTFLRFVEDRLEPHYDGIGTWPRRVVVVTQPFDFEATDNMNVPSVLWGWKDFFKDLKDGLGERDKNFLRNRFISWFRFSAFAKDRNERSAFPILIDKIAGNPADKHGRPYHLLVERMDKVLSARDEGEEMAFAALVDRFGKRGVRLEVVSMPFPPSVEDRIDSVKLLAWRSWMQARCAEPGCSFRMLDSKGAGLRDQDFIDDMIHMNAGGRAAIRKAFLGQGIFPAGGG